MSVAFTKEADSESQAAHLPDRPVSPHPNLVTESGLAAIEAALAAARAAYAAAQAQGEVSADRTAMARATRDLHYWSARRGSAQLVAPDAGREEVRFGDRVSFRRTDGRTQTLRIVGEDEADPAAGRVSYVSPVARALLGGELGQTVGAGAGALEILAID